MKQTLRGKVTNLLGNVRLRIDQLEFAKQQALAVEDYAEVISCTKIIKEKKIFEQQLTDLLA